MPRWITRQRESMRVTPLDFCLRIIVNEKPINLEKTTSSVLSVLLLIYGEHNNILRIQIKNIFFSGQNFIKINVIKNLQSSILKKKRKHVQSCRTGFNILHCSVYKADINTETTTLTRLDIIYFLFLYTCLQPD